MAPSPVVSGNVFQQDQGARDLWMFVSPSWVDGQLCIPPECFNNLVNTEHRDIKNRFKGYYMNCCKILTSAVTYQLDRELSKWHIRIHF